MNRLSAPETDNSFIRNELAGFRRVLLSALFLMLLLSVWQAMSTINIHKAYQASLMDTVTEQVISDYSEHMTLLRTKIDKFQIQYQQQIQALYRSGAAANRQDYFKLLQELKKNIEHVRLFSIIDADGEGTLAHITGDFLPDCKEEIHDTLKSGNQENLFFHHSQSSVHYDLLQPLLVDGRNIKFFVAFNIDTFADILAKYQLPQQQLFLLRKDHIGKVELTTVPKYASKPSQSVVMSEQEIASFSIQKAIPNTRWNIAIRLSSDYVWELALTVALKSGLVWLIASLTLFLTYRLKKVKTQAHFEALQELEYKESYDQLTGLMNRQSFVDTLEHCSDRLDSGHGVVVYLDLDKFQTVNNVHGYTKGELCLHACTKLLRSRINKKSKLARIGNDQFAIFNPDTPHINSEQYANELRLSIAQLDLSEIDEALTLTCCAGVVNLRSELDGATQIMNSVMTAVNLAKSKGRNRVQLYQSDDPTLKQHAFEMETLRQLKRAISTESLLLYRQEIQATNKEQNRRAYEVLVRMEQDGEILSPSLFIPIAEKNGFAIELDKFVIRQTIIRIARNADDSYYSINLSGQTLAVPNLIEYVKRCLNEYQVAPKQLTFEITETYAITHIDAAIEFIAHVTRLGCQFALDDFGSGLSSFSYLQRLPVQKLKIDGVFVRNLVDEPRNQSFVKTMIALAKSMDMETVAEYVETEADMQLLREFGIDYCQGYYIHKPSPWVVTG